MNSIIRLEKFYDNYLISLGADKRLSCLDVGCGWGFLAAYFQENYLGIEVDETKLNFAAKRYGSDKFIYHNLNMNALDNQFGYFDQCFALTVLDELPNKKLALVFINTHLKKGGKLYVEVRNRNFCVRVLLDRLGLGILRKRKFELKGKYDGDLTFSEYMHLFEDAGFTVKKTYKAQRSLISSTYLEFFKKIIYRYLDYIVPVNFVFMLGFELEKNK